MKAEFHVNRNKYPHFEQYFIRELNILDKNDIKYIIFDNPGLVYVHFHYDFIIYVDEQIRAFFRERFSSEYPICVLCKDRDAVFDVGFVYSNNKYKLCQKCAQVSVSLYEPDLIDES